MGECDELVPCRMCGGGETRWQNSKHWTGMRSVVTAYRLVHACSNRPPDIRAVTVNIVGSTENAVIKRWEALNHD